MQGHRYQAKDCGHANWHEVIKDWPYPYKRIPKAVHTVEASQGVMVVLLVSSDKESKDCVCVCVCVCMCVCG